MWQLGFSFQWCVIFRQFHILIHLLPDNVRNKDKTEPNLKPLNVQKRLFQEIIVKATFFLQKQDLR